METHELTAVRREVGIAAAPETVWAMLVDPEKLVRWMGVAATVEPQPGGEYRVEVVPGRTASGEIVELDPPRRLVVTWGWEGDDAVVPPGSTTLAFDLVPDGDGTLLVLTHSRLDAEAARRHTEGWEHYLPRLASAAAGDDPGPDPWAAG